MIIRIFRYFNIIRHAMVSKQIITASISKKKKNYSECESRNKMEPRVKTPRKDMARLHKVTEVCKGLYIHV